MVRRQHITAVHVFLMSLALVACNHSDKKDNGVSNPQVTQHANSQVSVLGMVANTQGIGVSGVEIYNENGVIATTNSSGSVRFSIDSQAAQTVRLRKTGFTTQSVILNILNGSASFEATIRQRQAPINLDAQTEIRATGFSGVRVSLPANSLVDADGNLALGTVQLTMTPVDISDDKEFGAFPGSFSGTDIDGNPAPLIMSYGTVEYHFSQNDKALNLAPGKQAIIEIPVFANKHPDGSDIQVGDAGALWYLDEKSGQWIQENTGTVVESPEAPNGMALRAEVTHFSWWNHDVAPQLCELTVIPAGLPENSDISLTGRTVVTSGSPRTGIADFSEGGTSLITPRNSPVIYIATAEATDGFYTASLADTCEGPADTMTLEFEGPESPKVRQFEGFVKPIFERADEDSPFEIIGNDGIFTWNVLGAEHLVLSSDAGHQTTLGDPAGSTQFPLDQNGTHQPSYFFSLNATTGENGDSESVSLEYSESHAPIVDYFSYDLLRDNSAILLFWDTRGADHINISYHFTPTDESVLYEEEQGIDIDVDQPLIVNLRDPLLAEKGPGVYIMFITFENQYGSSSQHLSFYIDGADDTAPGGTDNPGTDNSGTDNPGTDNPGTGIPGTDLPF